MEKKTEITASNLEKAQQEALSFFKLKNPDLLGYELLDEGKRSFLGLGSKKSTYQFYVKPEFDLLIKQVLGDYLVLANLEVAFDVKLDGSVLKITLTGEDEPIFVQGNGELMVSLEHYLKKYLSRFLELDREFNIQIDCKTHKCDREERLKELARKMRDKVLKTKRPVVLKPMPPSDRRVVHQFFSQDNQVTTFSLGDGYYKKLRIEIMRSKNNRDNNRGQQFGGPRNKGPNANNIIPKNNNQNPDAQPGIDPAAVDPNAITLTHHELQQASENRNSRRPNNHQGAGRSNQGRTNNNNGRFHARDGRRDQQQRSNRFSRQDNNSRPMPEVADLERLDEKINGNVDPNYRHQALSEVDLSTNKE